MTHAGFAVRRAEERLARAWLDEMPWARVLDALGELVPGEMVGMTSGLVEGVPYWGISASSEGYQKDLPSFVDKAAARRYRQYSRPGTGAFANRPVTFDDLAASMQDRHRARAHLDAIYPTEEVTDQLRVAFVRSGRHLGWVGVGRHSYGTFSVDERDRVRALAPHLERWIRDAAALGLEPVPSGAGLPVASLDVFDEVALVLRGDRIVFANRAGRRIADGSLPSPQSLRRHASFTCRFGGGDGATYELVRLPELTGPDDDPWSALPPSLRAVARLAAEGLADKEIADALGRPLSTVRTYMRRVFRRLGVNSRRELMALARPVRSPLE